MEVTIVLDSQNVKKLIAKEYGVSVRDIKMTTCIGNVFFEFEADENEETFTKDEVIAMIKELADEIGSLTMDNDPLDIEDYIREKIKTLILKEQEDGNDN